MLTRLNLTSFQFRQSSYRSSLYLVDVGDVKVKYEITNDPLEWKHVENVLPPLVVPDPKPKNEYPSGWKPPANNLGEQPYYVERTKNHMMPVYMQTSHRNTRRLTHVKKIKGDIWLLHNELKEFLQKESVVPIRSQVHEFAGKLCFHGDHVNAIKYYLTQKGY